MSEYLITYSGLLTQIINEQEGGRVSSLQKDLEGKGYRISYPTLLSYKNGRVVPTYEVAKKILDTVGYQITYEDLSQILEYSRSQMREINSDDEQYFQISLRLNPKLILDDPEAGASVLERVINERAEELFSNPELAKEFKVGKRKIGAYLMYLMQKDLKENY